MNVAIYARFSSNAQREASIEEQVAVCTEYAQRNNHNIVKVYNDNAISGKINDRPALQKVLSDSSKNVFSAVLVYSIDRFGRDLFQALYNQRVLNENGVTLISATENFSDDASGRFFKNIMMAYSQFYSEELADKLKRGKKYNAENCLYNGGRIPLGYQVGKDRHFEINPDTAPIVQHIFEMYADGKTVSEIANYMNSLGVKTSKGAEFNKNSLHTMLKSKKYIGVYVFNDIEIPDGMPRIISDELFNKVADIMKKNRKAPARAKAKVSYILTTKLFCGHCKEMMIGYSGTGKLGKTYHYYLCKGKMNKVCNKKTVDKDYIEDLVVSECRRQLTAANITKIAHEVVAIYSAERDTSNLTRLKKLLSENERKYQNTLNAIMESDIESVRKALGEKVPQLEAEHKEIEKQIAIEEAPYPIVDEAKIRFFLTSLKKGNINDLKYRRALIDVFVNQIFLYDDRITITYNSGEESVTISDQLLEKLEDAAEAEKVLFLNSNVPYIKRAPIWVPFWYMSVGVNDDVSTMHSAQIGGFEFAHEKCEYYGKTLK